MNRKRILLEILNSVVFFSGMKVMIDTLNLEKSIYWIMLYITLTGPSLHNDDTKKQTLVMLSSLFFFTVKLYLQ